MKEEQSIKNPQNGKKKGYPKRAPASQNKSGITPYLVAGLVCLCTAFSLGTGAWWLFGQKLRPEISVNPTVVTSTSPTPVTVLTSSPTPITKTEDTPESKIPNDSINIPPLGTVAVSGGVIELGGQDLDNPARKVNVTDFYIAETEVTNEQFQEFIVATKHKPPLTWLKGGEIPPGRGQFPVTGVTFQDALDYCVWLSQKLKALVRLPSEAEWEIAARGPQRFLYPWGNEWSSKAAVWLQNGGKLQKVKSLPEGRAACGAYDMAGNAWEWTSDNALTTKGKPLLAGVKSKKIIKGGAAEESKELISATSRTPLIENGAHKLVGFRYIVEQVSANQNTSRADSSPTQKPSPMPTMAH